LLWSWPVGLGLIELRGFVNTTGLQRQSRRYCLQSVKDEFCRDSLPDHSVFCRFLALFFPSAVNRNTGRWSQSTPQRVGISVISVTSTNTETRVIIVRFTQTRTETLEIDQMKIIFKK